MIDLFMTTKDRPHLLRSSLRSLESCTERGSYRLTIINDGDYRGRDHDANLVEEEFSNIIDHVLINKKNSGLGPSINMALAHIDTLKRWDTSPNPFTCYIQDDILFSPDENKVLYTAIAGANIPDNLIPSIPGSSTQKQEREIKEDEVSPLVRWLTDENEAETDCYGVVSVPIETNVADAIMSLIYDKDGEEKQLLLIKELKKDFPRTQVIY